VKVCGTRSVLADYVGSARLSTTSLHRPASFEIGVDENVVVVVVVVAVAAAAAAVATTAFLRLWLRPLSYLNQFSKRQCDP